MRFTLLWLLLLGGCDFGSTGPVKTQLPLRTIKAASAATEAGGVAMRANVITWDSARRYPQAMATMHWLEANDAQPMRARRGAVGPPVERWGDLPVVPIPTFVLGVQNHSGHAITISPDQFQLSDDRGKLYELQSDKSAIGGRIESDINGMYAGLLSSRPVLDGLREKVGQLPFLTGPVELPDGQGGLFLLVFKIDLHNPVEYDAYFSEVARLTLLVNGAALGFERAQVALDVTCPDSGGAPDLSRCKPGNMFPRAGKAPR